ncbi:hypothetical protein DPMN_136476 [Dreissena polymorpha]|uniref:Uncharacterized protein n=1 Tax=Dreissena polymorpha TaxID=45954 RepID=A0A9D4G3X0_DREPO|nr:hypothetical protein DPMN_136476 [Dreissena polymorpha]
MTALPRRSRTKDIPSSSGHPPSEKDYLKLCEIYSTTSLISHHNKAMLRIILNQLKNKTEEHMKAPAVNSKSQQHIL